MCMVDMSVDTKQPLHDSLTDLFEVPWKLLADFRRKDTLVIQLILYPCHNVVNVLRGTCLHPIKQENKSNHQKNLQRFAIFPVVFMKRAGTHYRTGFLGTHVADRAVQHVDLVENINNCN